MAKSGNAGIEFECSSRAPALLEAMLRRHTGKGYPPRPIDFECERVRASRIQRVPKVNMYHLCTYNANRTAMHSSIVSKEWMEENLTRSAAVWFVQGRIGEAAGNIPSRSLPVHRVRTAATYCFGILGYGVRITSGIIRRTECTGKRDDVKIERRPGRSCDQKEEL